MTMESILYEGFKGEAVAKRVLTESDGLYAKSLKARTELIEKLSEYDDELADLYLAGEAVSADAIRSAVKRTICNPKHLSKVCAVMLGASVKNKGVQSLLDGIISYLPSPTERPAIRCHENPKLERRPVKTDSFCGYIFKIIHDK